VPAYVLVAAAIYFGLDTSVPVGLASEGAARLLSASF